MTGEINQRDIVLIVDDSPDALSFLTESLEKAGFSVLIATSGLSGLSIVEKITPDIVLMDAVMPGLDGFETCIRLKAHPVAAQVPVIFMTGLTETEHVVRALSSGGVDYVTKPINMDELLARISVHLANARSAQSARVALDASGRHLMAVRRDGRLRWTTPQANRLAASTFGDNDSQDSLTKALAKWIAAHEKDAQSKDVPLQVTGAHASIELSFIGVIGADELLFRLSGGPSMPDGEKLREAFHLTAREADVLIWIAKGKANRDIGEILGLSARTVNKHLEQIYVKLGVENRASAAVKAAAILRAD